jgi:hypothetical protein
MGNTHFFYCSRGQIKYVVAVVHGISTGQWKGGRKKVRDGKETKHGYLKSCSYCR